MSAPLLALALSATVAAGRPHQLQRDPDLDPVRAGVLNLRDGANISGGVSGLVGNLIAAGIGITLAVLIGTDVLFEGDDSIAKPLIVAALSVGAASQISEALYNVLSDPATVISADELLDDEESLAASGMFFLRDRARDGRDKRIRGIITDSTSAAGGIIAGSILLTSDITVSGDTKVKNILAGIAIGIGTLQLVSTLFEKSLKSVEEKVYEAVLGSGE